MRQLIYINHINRAMRLTEDEVNEALEHGATVIVDSDKLLLLANAASQFAHTIDYDALED